MRRIKNMLDKRQKLCDIENIRWYQFDLGWRCQNWDTLNFINETSYFLLHILVTYFESFSKQYKNIFFLLNTFQIISLKITISSALALLKLHHVEITRSDLLSYMCACVRVCVEDPMVCHSCSIFWFQTLSTSFWTFFIRTWLLIIANRGRPLISS